MKQRFKGVIGLNNTMGFLNLGCLFGMGYCWGADNVGGVWCLVGIMFVISIYHFLYEAAKDHYDRIELYNQEQLKKEKKKTTRNKKIAKSI